MSPLAKERIGKIRSFCFRVLPMKIPLSLFFVLTLLGSCEHRNTQPTDHRPAVTDDFGHVLHLGITPKRIISLAPSLTETLYALGLDSSVAGVTDYCDFPPAARLKPKVGGMLNPNIERIVDLRPDLIVMSASGNLETDYRRLTSLGIPAFVSNPRTIDGVFKSILDIGRLTGCTSSAESLVDSLTQQRDELARRAQAEQPRKVILLLSLNPIIAVGHGTFLDQMIAAAHGENIVRDSTTAYPLVSREEIFRRQPDVILATNDMVKSEEAIVAAYPEWKGLPAIRNRRVALMDASIISRPGPRIVKGLELLVRAIHDTT
jgi:iron complex transport system substrate-binding protein